MDGNKFLQWKKRQDPPISTGDLAKILETTPGWVSTLLNQPEDAIVRRCSFDLALKIWILTRGEVKIVDMMTSPAELHRLRQRIGHQMYYLQRRSAEATG